MNVYSQCKDTIIFLNQEKKHKELFTSLSCNTNDIERYPELALPYASHNKA